jgi:hypothetical protein
MDTMEEMPGRTLVRCAPGADAVQKALDLLREIRTWATT